ncbi:MAG TPA: polymer-forming cytoskeletal protein, partial [Candidatus Acidoferrales bacterium]|nr:polymer-forming cytoskeletal protein [Candidatus Acidoferrales bacterium]
MNRSTALAIFLTCVLVAAFAFTTAAARAAVRSVDHGGTYMGDVIVEPGQTVDGDITVVFGDATIAGTVNGDVNVIGGSAEERPGAIITGQVNMLGGDVTNNVVPWAPRHVIRDAFGADVSILWRIAWDVVVLLVFLVFP